MKIDIDMPKFNRDIEAVKKASKRSSDQMLDYTMILLLQAGRSGTKLGRKNRSLVTQDAEMESDKDLGLKADYGKERVEKVRFFRVFKQGSHIPKKVFVPRIPRKTKTNAAERDEAMKARDVIVAKFKKINYRGIARASWGWAMKAVSAKARFSASADEQAIRARNNPINVMRQLAGDVKSLTVTNKLGWILRIAPGLEQRMINSADARLQKTLERILQKEIDTAVRKSA